MSKSLKRLLVLVLALVLVITVFSGCQKDGDDTQQTTATTTTRTTTTGAGTTTASSATETQLPSVPFENPVPITWMIASPGWFSYTDDPALKNIFSEINMVIEFKELDASVYREQVQLAIVSQTLADVVDSFLEIAMLYGPQGAFLNLADYTDRMPTIMNYLENNLGNTIDSLILEDVGMFIIPRIQEQTDFPEFSWVVNKVELDRLNLSVPKTMDEVLNTARALKTEHPDLYPIFAPAPNVALDQVWLDFLLPSFGAGSIDINYYIHDGAYKYSPLTPEFKEAVSWMRTAYAEKLIPEDYATYPYANYRRTLEGDFKWLMPETLREGDSIFKFNDGKNEQYLFTKGSQTAAWLYCGMAFSEVRYVSSSAKRSETDFWVQQRGVSPKLTLIDTPTDSGKLSATKPKGWQSKAGFVLNAKMENEPDKLAQVLAMFDWFYSEDGILRANYGIEGIQYTMVNDKPVINSDLIWDTPRWMELMYNRKDDDMTYEEMTEYLFQNSFVVGSWGRAYFVFTPKEWWFEMFNVPFMLDHLNKFEAMDDSNFSIRYLKEPNNFTRLEQDTVVNVRIRLNDYVKANIDGFIMGSKNMDSDWNDFIKALNSMGAGQLEEIYNSK